MVLLHDFDERLCIEIAVGVIDFVLQRILVDSSSKYCDRVVNKVTYKTNLRLHKLACGNLFAGKVKLS